MEPQIIDFYNEYPNIINVIDKLNEEYEILKSEHEIVGVMTQPDRKSGRGKKIHFSPVKQLAELERLNLLQPNNLKNDEFIESFTALEPDLFLVVAYGLIIPKQILEIF